jgi:hypothetical protein
MPHTNTRSFDCVAVRFADGNFAQDDMLSEGGLKWIFR